MTNKTIGKYGEELAKNFLIKNGYKIVEMNFRYSRMAEIDIIAEKSGVLHFVEVKTRTSLSFGAPIEAIDNRKLASIFSCANFYLQKSKKKYKKFQIDAVGIVVKKNSPEDFKIDLFPPLFI